MPAKLYCRLADAGFSYRKLIWRSDRSVAVSKGRKNVSTENKVTVTVLY